MPLSLSRFLTITTVTVSHLYHHCISHSISPLPDVPSPLTKVTEHHHLYFHPSSIFSISLTNKKIRWRRGRGENLDPIRFFPTMRQTSPMTTLKGSLPSVTGARQSLPDPCTSKEEGPTSPSFSFEIVRECADAAPSLGTRPSECWTDS